MSKNNKVSQTKTEPKSNVDLDQQARESNATLYNQSQLDDEIKKAVAEALAAKKKEPKEKKEKAPKKEPKGIMIEFENTAGKTIRGLGNLYYVVRFEKKLHYKAADAVRIIQPEEQPQVDVKDNKAEDNLLGTV